MAVNDLHRVTIGYTSYGQKHIAVLHYLETATGTGTADVVLSQRADAVVGVGFKNAIGDTAIYDEATAQRVLPAPPSLSVVTTTNAGVGTAGTGALPTTVAAVLTKRTINAGPSWRGRLFMGAVPPSFVTNSALNATGQASYGALAAVLASSLAQAGYTFQPVLYRKTAGNVMPITTFEPRITLRVQRRREVGLGI